MHLSGAAGPHPGRLVLLRDALGILSVMCCLDDGLVLDPVFQRDYREESAALEGLSEPRVAVPLSYVVDAAGRIVAVVRRHVEGVLLSDVLERMARGLDVQTAATVVKDVLTALAALHGRGVAQRSIDPSHVIVEPHGGSVLIDTGLQPRRADQGPGAELIEDLAAVPQLFASCVTTGRLVPGPESQRYFAVGELEGVSRDLCSVLDEARQAAPARWSDGGGAGAMLAAFNTAVSDFFDAGWDDRGRERLASAVAQTPSPVGGRYFDFVPFADRGGRSKTRRGKRAGVPSSVASALGPDFVEVDPAAARPAAARPAAPSADAANPAAANQVAANPAAPDAEASGAADARTVTVWSTFPASGAQDPAGVAADAARTPPASLNRDRGISQAWQAALANASRRATEWLGDTWPTGAGTARAPASGGPKSPMSPRTRTFRRRLRILISRVAVPLIAFLVALALSRIFLGGTVASHTGHHGSPAPAPARSLTAVPPVAVTQSLASTVVTSVLITSLGDDPNAAGQAAVTVAVRTSGTGAVNITVQISEPTGDYGSASTTTHTDHFAESGQQSYTITDSFPVASLCSRYGSAVAATVTITAAAVGGTDAPLTASGKLLAGHC